MRKKMKVMDILLEAAMLANGLLICAMTVGVMPEDNLTVFDLVVYMWGCVCITLWKHFKEI